MIGMAVIVIQPFIFVGLGVFTFFVVLGYWDDW